MTKEIFARFRSSKLAIHSSFRAGGAFTLIELIVTVTIIVILAGLVLSTVGYVQKKAARSRAETEIAALSAACENYKADNGVYPKDPTAGSATDTLDARTMGNPATFQTASLVLYRALSGDRNLDRAVSDTDRTFNIDGTALSPPLSQLPQSYFAFKPNMLSPADQTLNVQFVRDPFGNSYGYSTAYQHDIEQGNPPTHGYNPTFDLWSTATLTSSPPSLADQNQWIKNW